MRRLNKAETELLALGAEFLLKGYFSPLARANGSLYSVLAAYAVCLMLSAALAAAGFSAAPVLALAAAAAVIFALYHQAAEKAVFERLYRQYQAQFAPAYQRRFALPAGRNKIYAYKIAGKQGLIKIGQTEKRTEDRISAQLRTADIRPEILWEIYAEGSSGRVFDDHALHRFLARRGFRRVQAASGSNTEWFEISPAELHKAVYEFYLRS